MISIWTIYRHPKDYPDKFVAREFHNDRPTDNVIVDDDLATLRGVMKRKGLVRFNRDPTDHAVIVESWL